MYAYKIIMEIVCTTVERGRFELDVGDEDTAIGEINLAPDGSLIVGTEMPRPCSFVPCTCFVSNVQQHIKEEMSRNSPSGTHQSQKQDVGAGADFLLCLRQFPVAGMMKLKNLLLRVVFVQKIN